MNKFLMLLAALALFAGCNGSTKQIVACYNTCKSVMSDDSSSFEMSEGKVICVCKRFYTISSDGNTVTEHK